MATRRRASGPKGHWYRCLVEGCREYGRIIYVNAALTPRIESDRHYMAEHYVPGGPPVASRADKESNVP